MFTCEMSQKFKNTFFRERLRLLLLEGVCEGTKISGKIFEKGQKNPNWRGEKKFDVYFCVFFDCYCESLICGRETGRWALCLHPNLRFSLFFFFLFNLSLLTICIYTISIADTLSNFLFIYAATYISLFFFFCVCVSTKAPPAANTPWGLYLLQQVSRFILLVVNRICTKHCKVPNYYD